jgi:hypothetical protein
MGVAFSLIAMHVEKQKREMYNNRHVDVKLAPEYFDGKLIISLFS